MNAMRILIGLAVIVLALMLYQFWGDSNRETINIWYQLKGEARGQRYYLAKRMLEENGVEVEFENTYANLLPLDEASSDTTIFFTESTESLTSNQLNSLKNWVREGGQVVSRGDVQIYPFEREVNRQGELIEPDRDAFPWLEDMTDSESDDVRDDYTEEGDLPYQRYRYRLGLMDYLGLELVKICNNKPPSKFPSEFTRDITTSNGKLTVNAGYGVTYVFSDYLDDNETYPVINRIPSECTGSLLDRYQIGKGTMTFYHTPSILFGDRPHGRLNDENRKARIAEYDHASYLLYVLSQDGTLPKKVRWFRSAFYPSYMDMLKKYGFPALLAMIFGTIAFIWRHLRRFGPFIVEDTRKALSLKRHLQASGEFLYSNGARDVLLKDTHHALLTELGKAIRHFDKMAQEKRIEMVVTLTNLPESTVILALSDITTEQCQKDTLFTQKIKAIQIIRETL